MRIRAFTLIELMAVIAVLVLLTGMLMPVVGIANRKAGNTNAIALLTKVEAALEMFKGEMDTYPYLAHDTSDPFTTQGNQLARTLATNFADLTTAEQAAVKTDMQAARAAYLTGAGSVHVIAATDVDPRIIDDYDRLPIYAEYVNRLATERAVMAVLAGNPMVTGIDDDQAVQIISNPTSAGYTFDFLTEDLNPKDVSNTRDILDFWGQPLLYNCPVIQGVVSFYPNSRMRNNNFGQGLEYDDDPAIDPKYYNMDSKGRTVTTSAATDQRTHAAADYALRYELWSAGRDQLIHETRNHSRNKDNIAATDYHEGLE